jgi:hypothetical protein
MDVGIEFFKSHVEQARLYERFKLHGEIAELARNKLEPSLLRDECTGTSVTHWTGDIRYKSLAELRA